MLQVVQDVFGGVPFVVTPAWSAAVQVLAVLSLVASALVLGAVGWIWVRHKKYLSRLSLRVSGYVALADMLNAAMAIVLQHNPVMLAASRGVLRLILWAYMFSTLAGVFLTLSISVQLHLSTFTRVRVGTYMRLERFYVPASFLVAAILPAIQVAVMRGISWDPLMHSFKWPTDVWRVRLALWMCSYAWIVATIVYCAAIALLVSLRIWQMWRNSVEIAAAADAPRVPEKWDWSRLAASPPTSVAGSQCTLEAGPETPVSPQTPGTGRPGYVVTLTGSDSKTGQPVAVRTFVDKRRFLMSMQRLACYPLVPVITQLGTVAMNMTSAPVRSLYIYGTTAPAALGLLNLVVFLLNPALPDILRDAVHGPA
ncbi:hypothetical protein IWQ57_006009 [Coemansia nantahalensis]|uniref:Uncharacterized protein n=1 Tax=Coemansia nantahalensis TaxID=2789366 RepID=A0ACC1JLI4_9FUNG|nr:hypothetical protein IWQ57_006009 [Coemansia nantahalensis]